MPTLLRVLILEDRPEDCALMLHELREAGFDPVWRRVDTEAGYLGALSPDFDVILADYTLSSFDASRALRHLAERGLDIPFIVVSGTLGDERAAAIIKEGATDYLLKDRLARLGPAITSAIKAMRQRWALRDAESRYRGLFERVPLGLYRSAPTGEIMDANPALVQMLGYPDRQSLLAVNAIDLYVDSEQRSQFQALIAAQGTVRGFETQFRRRDGSVLSVRLIASLVQDAEGRALYYEGAIEDVTERVRADEAARRSAAMFRDLVETAPDGIVIDDREGRITLVNAQAEQMFGYARDEMLGRPVEMLLPERFRDAHVHHRATYYAAPRRRPMGAGLDLVARRRDGVEFPVEIGLSQVRTNGDLLVVSVVRDITARKHIEEALRQTERLAAMGSLLAGVAHELNNPLSVVLGHSALLAQAVKGSVAERATKIAASAERCARIVKNFLALARQHPPERQSVALGGIVREAVELVAYQLRVGDVEVTLDFPQDLPVLGADPHQLQQVFVNLITNAHHALSEVGPPRRLTISARHNLLRAALTVDVADTGPGMPPEVRTRIFEPFFTTKPSGEGTGLGLAICKGIIEGHGGTIIVESAPGRGTVFRIEFPVTPVPEAAGATLPLGAARSVRNLSILIVDDEPDVGAVLAEVLAVDGHRVETAPNGARALEKLHACTYDAILSDLRMPELDGPSLYRTLAHQGHPLIQRFIFVTGDVLSGETQRFLEETGVLCVSKPFDLAQVRRVLDAAFRRGG